MAASNERFRQYAAECLRIAQNTNDENQKARLLEMAEGGSASPRLRPSEKTELSPPAAPSILQSLGRRSARFHRSAWPLARAIERHLPCRPAREASCRARRRTTERALPA